jgi:glycosyltransferase involved in cell wall biosynthesis
VDHPGPPLGGPAHAYSVGFDATPLGVPIQDVGGHTLRGIGRYIAGLLDALVSEQPEWSNQHLRTIVTGDYSPPRAGNAIVTRRATWRRQDTGWWTSWLADRWAISRTRLSLWHALDPNLPLSPLPSRRTLVTAYDLIALHEPAVMARIRAHRRPIYGLYLRSLSRARLVIAISDVTARDLRETLGVAARRIHVVHPALRVPDPPHRPIATDEPPNLLFVGVPDPTKQPELAVAALAELRRRGHRVRLRFVGHHRPSDQADLSALAASHAVGDEVDFLGRVGDAQLTDLYRQSVLLAVSRIEGFGLPPAEALLAGGRVICGTAPVYREVLGDAPEYTRSPDGNGLADAYEAVAARPQPGPPQELVDRLSPRATAAALVGAYQAALEDPADG